jgi:hypothetical protein
MASPFGAGSQVASQHAETHDDEDALLLTRTITFRAPVGTSGARSDPNAPPKGLIQHGISKSVWRGRSRRSRRGVAPPSPGAALGPPGLPHGHMGC